MRLYEVNTIIQQSEKKTFSASGQKNHIVLNIIGYEEPNNGRDLYIVELLINGENRTRSFFGGRNRIGVTLDKYQFCDSEGRFCFLPAEQQYFLLDIQTLQKIELPVTGCRFTGNLFDNNQHLLINSDSLILTDLKGQTSNEHHFEEQSAIEWAYFIDDKNLRVIYYFSNLMSVYNLPSRTLKQASKIIDEPEFTNTFRWIVWSYKKQQQNNILEMEWVGSKDPTKDRRSFILEEATLQLT